MKKHLLIIGDVAAILVLTVVGFATHGETDASFLPRAVVMFVSHLTGWFLLAPAMGLFGVDAAREGNPLWRPALTGFFAAQFAVTMRGLLLQSDVSPLFALVLGGTAAIGMTLWRFIFAKLTRQ